MNAQEIIAMNNESTVEIAAQEVVANEQRQTATMQHEQTPARKHQFGVKGGLNIAKELANQGKDSHETNPRIGVHLGVFMELPISATVDFQPELLYSMQGGRYQGVTDQIDYINLPLMFKIYVWDQRFSIDVGPQFGYMIGAKISDGRNSHSFYDDESLSKFDFSIALGFSFKLNDKIDLGFRGTTGITNMYEGEYNFKNSVTQLGIGFKF